VQLFSNAHVADAECVGHVLRHVLVSGSILQRSQSYEVTIPPQHFSSLRKL